MLNQYLQHVTFPFLKKKKKRNIQTFGFSGFGTKTKPRQVDVLWYINEEICHEKNQKKLDQITSSVFSL